MLGLGYLGLVALGRVASERVIDAIAVAAVAAVCTSDVTVTRQHSASCTATSQATQSSWLFVYQPSVVGNARSFAANTILSPLRTAHGVALATATGQGITIENVYAAGDAVASALAEGIAGGTNAYGNAIANCVSTCEFHQLRRVVAGGTGVADVTGGGIGIYIASGDVVGTARLHSEAQVNNILDAYGDGLVDAQVAGHEWLNLRTSAAVVCSAAASGSHQYGAVAAANCSANATGSANIKYAILGSASLAGAATLSDISVDIFKAGFPDPIVCTAIAYGYPKRDSAGFSNAVSVATLSAAYQRNRFDAGVISAGAIGNGTAVVTIRSATGTASAVSVGADSVRLAEHAYGSAPASAALSGYWALAIRGYGTAASSAIGDADSILAEHVAGSATAVSDATAIARLNFNPVTQATVMATVIPNPRLAKRLVGSATVMATVIPNPRLAKRLVGSATVMAIGGSSGVTSRRTASGQFSASSIAEAFPMVNVLSQAPALYTLYVQADSRVVNV